MAQIIQIRRDTAANWTAANPILAQGEPALEIDTKKEKIGDGVTAWNSLAYKQAGVSSSLIIQPEATSSLILDGTQKGEWNLYDFNSASAQTVQIDNGYYSQNDIINIKRSGQGTLEILAGTNVRISGVRDIYNRYFVNDPNSIVSLICEGNDGTNDLFSIVGNLKRGYTGQITTTSYSSLYNGLGAQNVTVTGSGFSANMEAPVLTGNATFNSWSYVSPTQIIINMTETGAVDDTITVTYWNGDEFVDTDAITIIEDTYNTDDLRHYYPLSADSNDAVIVGAINGVDTSMTYSAGYAVFDGTASKITLGDDDSLSYGNGVTDQPMSITGTVNGDVVTGGRIACKWGNGVNQEYRVELNSGKIRLAVKDMSTGITVTYESNTVLSTATDYHFAITKSIGNDFNFYINGSLTTKTNITTGTYAAMENLTDDLTIGQLSYSNSQAFDGKIRRLGFWNVELPANHISDIYTEEVTNNNDLL